MGAHPLLRQARLVRGSLAQGWSCRSKMRGARPRQAGGAAWRTGCFMDAPTWVRAVMADGFRTPAGAAAVAGLFGAPLWLWARRHLPGSAYAAAPLGAALGAGRLVAAAVEAWVVLRHARGLLDEDAGRARARGAPGAAGGAAQADGDAALGAE